MKKTFLKGAMILGIAGIFVKIMGAFFRIPLTNIIGDSGMGYYSSAYPIYVFLLVFSTAGIPIAISKLVSERLAVNNTYEAHRIFKISLVLLFIIGTTTFFILFVFSGTISSIIKNPNAVYSMRAIAPALFFVSLMAAFRGYFQGMQDMKPTANSQLIEQFFRVAVGLCAAYFLLPKGLEFSAAGASFGASAGGIFGLMAVLYIYIRRRKKILATLVKTDKESESSKKIIYKIFIISVPITLGAAIMPCMSMIDVFVVMRRLQEIGFSSDAARELFGQLSGMAAPLINFPQAISMAIAMSLVPAIASANESKDIEGLKNNIQLGMRSAIIIGLPCTVGLMVLAEPIMLLLYPLQKASAISAAESLFVLGAGVIFLLTVQTLTGILQGLGKQSIPVINLFIGAVFKIILTYSLTGIESINIKGAAFGTVIAYLIASGLNFYAVKKYTKVNFDFSSILGRPLAAAGIMGVIVFFMFKGIGFFVSSNGVATLASVFIGVMAYFILIILTKAITIEEINALPKGEKLAKIAQIIQNLSVRRKKP